MIREREAKRGVASLIPFGNPGLFNEFVQNLDVAAFETPLMRVGKIIKWELFEPKVMAAVTLKAKGPGGRPRFHPMLMLKVLVLQRLHGLADDATSFQITDRNSLRAFLGPTPGDAVPDGQTISDFREALNGSMTEPFGVFLSHLQTRHGLALAQEGVMMDASFAEVPKQRNRRDENALIKEGTVPPTLAEKPKVLAHKDTDARWTKKNHGTHYGYKDRVKVDVKDKLIIDAVVPPASVHESQVIDQLVKEGDQVVYADSECKSAEIDAGLEARNVKEQIHEKGTRGHPLSEEQKAGNREKSKIRSRVEHVFAQMRGSMKALFERCIGMTRNAACLLMSNLVSNMLRFEQIQRLKLNPRSVGAAPRNPEHGPRRQASGQGTVWAFAFAERAKMPSWAAQSLRSISSRNASFNSRSCGPPSKKLSRTRPSAQASVPWVKAFR